MVVSTNLFTYSFSIFEALGIEQAVIPGTEFIAQCRMLAHKTDRLHLLAVEKGGVAGPGAH